MNNCRLNQIHRTRSHHSIAHVRIFNNHACAHRFIMKYEIQNKNKNKVKNQHVKNESESNIKIKWCVWRKFEATNRTPVWNGKEKMHRSEGINSMRLQKWICTAFGCVFSYRKTTRKIEHYACACVLGAHMCRFLNWLSSSPFNSYAFVCWRVCNVFIFFTN